ncbi:MAG: hypothetical protein JW717_07970 [Marinilabiliaceae bacterium]|nr:hypothetical protein [Marinilabiliaceae bacterium]
MSTNSVIFSQNSLNKDVKVIREYNPTVSDAIKIEQMPELDDTTSYHPTFKYSILSHAFATANELEPISPAKMAKTKPGLLNNSYSRFGIGSQNTIMGELYYNLLRNKKYVVGLSIGHESSDGKVILENDSESETPFHTTWSDLFFKSIFKKITLSTNLHFDHNIYNYYGFQTIDENQYYTYANNTGSFSGNDLKFNNTQRISSFALGLGLKNLETKLEKTKWHTNFNYLTFGTKTGAKHNRFEINGKLHTPANTLFFDLDAKLSAFSTILPDSIEPMFNFKNQHNTDFSLLPKIGLQYDMAYVEAGLLLAGRFGGSDSEFKATPHITGTLTIAEGIVSIFGGLTGKYNFNDYETIYRENPFVSPDATVKNSFYGIDLHGGITGNFSSTTSFSARFDYNYFNDEHFFINRYYLRNTASSIDTFDYSNVFDIIHDNGSLLKVQGELLINPSELLNIRMHACYNGWNLKNQQYAWFKPETEIGFSGKIKVSETFSINSSINLLGFRYTFIPGIEPKKLNSIFDLNIGGNYLLNKTWSFWTTINNAAFMKYYKWNGYPSYGLSVMIGASYSF